MRQGLEGSGAARRQQRPRSAAAGLGWREGASWFPPCQQQPRQVPQRSPSPPSYLVLGKVERVAGGQHGHQLGLQSVAVRRRAGTALHQVAAPGGQFPAHTPQTAHSARSSPLPAVISLPHLLAGVVQHSHLGRVRRPKLLPLRAVPHRDGQRALEHAHCAAQWREDEEVRGERRSCAAGQGSAALSSCCPQLEWRRSRPWHHRTAGRGWRTRGGGEAHAPARQLPQRRSKPLGGGRHGAAVAPAAVDCREGDTAAKGGRA